MIRIVCSSLLSVLVLALASCGNSGSGGSAPAAKLQNAWAPWLGENLASEVARLWEPAFASQAEVDAAVAARDFPRYCSAMRSACANYTAAAAATRKTLDRSVDQTWRPRLLQFTGAGDDSVEPRVRVWDLTGHLPKLSERSPEEIEWLRGQRLEHPEDAGGMTAVFTFMKGEDFLLQRYFGLALSEETAKSAARKGDQLQTPAVPDR